MGINVYIPYLRGFGVWAVLARDWYADVMQRQEGFTRMRACALPSCLQSRKCVS